MQHGIKLPQFTNRADLHNSQHHLNHQFNSQPSINGFLKHNIIGGYSSTVGTGRVTPNNNHNFLGGVGMPGTSAGPHHSYINTHLLNNVLSSLGSVQGAGGYFNFQRELYNLLQGSQLGSCSRKISNADWFADRSFSNEPANERSKIINNHET